MMNQISWHTDHISSALFCLAENDSDWSFLTSICENLDLKSQQSSCLYKVVTCVHGMYFTCSSGIQPIDNIWEGVWLERKPRSWLDTHSVSQISLHIDWISLVLAICCLLVSSQLKPAHSLHLRPLIGPVIFWLAENYSDWSFLRRICGNLDSKSQSSFLTRL